MIPLIRREHVAGFYARKPVWLVENLPLETMRAEAEAMEHEAANFYTLAAKATTDADTRLLLGDLAAAEQGHEQRAGELAEANLSGEEGEEESRTAHRQFILTWVQPGLAGLMDGSVSTLAPIFATAFATQDTWTTFLVGSAVELVIAQRLVRRLCVDCAKTVPVDRKKVLPALEALGMDESFLKDVTSLKEAVGCRKCRNTGYRGRVGVFEIFHPKPLHDLIVSRVSNRELTDKAIEQGMRPLAKAGWIKVAAGLTTIDELVRNLSSNE